jgi:hypothetical protein
MAKYLVERFGAGSLEVGSVVELTEAEASFYASKVRKIEDEKTLEVATPKRATRKKAE